MARRRSLNRRTSRKSLNITELDQNSELVDSRDPLWWKNIEGDMTVRQSRLSYYGDMTEPILNEDSVVSTSSLKKEWWKSLDKTASESPRRISSRKSLQVAEASSELHYSEGSEDSSIKKRKVALRARDKREVGTDNFMAVLKDSNVPSDGKEISKSRSEETLASPRQRNRQSQGKNIAESDADTTVNTSNDTDVVLKPRPKPFKKRFTKISDGSFDNVESPQVRNPLMLQRSSEKQPIDKPADNPSLMGKSPAKLSNVVDTQLMGPPKTTSHRKRLSSISRKLDLSSEESEGDEGLRRKRLGYRKKSRKGVSINPFDKLIGDDFESEGIPSELGTGNEESTLTDLGKTNSRDENLAQISHFPDSPIKNKSANRSNALENQRKNSLPQSFSGENSQSQQIEDESDDDGENLESSSTRLSLEKKSVIQKKGGSSETLEKQAARSSRSVRLSKRSIDKSAYDLLPHDRSTTPVISDSDGGKEKSLSPGPKSGRTSRISLRNNRSATENPRGPVEPTILSKSQTNTVRKSRGNNSRTRIFSDEDISIEDKSPNNRNEYLNTQNNRDVRKSRKSFAANKSHGINQSGESTMENDGQGESISKTINSRLQEHVRKSPESRPRSITGIISNDKIQARGKFNADSTGVEPEIVDQSISTHLRPFRKSNANQSHTSNLYDKVSEPGEIDDDEDAHDLENSLNFQSKENTRRSRKSIANKTPLRTQSKKLSELEESEDEQETAQGTEHSGLLNKSNISRRRFTNKSQKTFESQAETNDEPEVADESISSDLQSKENTRRSRKSVVNKSRTRTQSKKLSEPEETEDEREIAQEKENSGLPGKSNNSRRITNESEETFEPQEETNDEPENADGSISWHLRSTENTRTSQKSVANKSQTNNQKRASRESEESEDSEENSQGMTNSRLRKKSNNSKEKFTTEFQGSVETSEEEEIHLAPNNATLSGSQSEKKLRSSRKSLAPLNRSRQNVQSLEDVQEDEPEAAEETDTRSSSSQIREKSRNFGKSYVTSKNNVSGENSRADKNPKEIHQKSQLSGAEKKSVTFGKSASKNVSKTIESDVSTSEAETEKNYENTETPERRKQSRGFKKSFGTNDFRQRSLSSDNDSGDETDTVQKKRSTSMNNQTQGNTQFPESVSENEEENVKKSDSNSQKSRASKKSFPLAGSRKSFQPLEKIIENETEISKKLITTSTPKSLARPSVSQRNYNPNEIVNKNNDDNSVPLIGKKSKNSAGLLRDVLITPKAKNSRESLLSKNQNAEDSSRLNSLNFTSLAANIAKNHHSTPLQVQKNITDFFPSKFLQKSNNPTIEVTTTFDKEKLKVVKEKLEEMKKREMESMQREAEAKKKEVMSKKRPVDTAKQKKMTTGETATKKTKIVDKAFIVNGVVYRRPRLPRPKPWVTDRLYRHLWKLMEPKYHLSTRIKSEQFIQDLAKTVVLVTRRSQYESYKHELNKLMKNMAHLGIINTRNDFYDFCYDFLPYDFRVKVTPIMMPGNVLTIPYDPTKLHTPLLPEP